MYYARNDGHAQGATILRSDWTYNTGDHVLDDQAGHTVRFTKTRGDVLEAVLRCQGRPANYDYIRGFVWDDSHRGMSEANEVKVMMSHIRGTLHESHVDFDIRTVWGLGYFSTRKVAIIAPMLKCCPRCQRPITLEEADRGDYYDGRSDSAAQAARNGKEATGIERRKIAGVR